MIDPDSVRSPTPQRGKISLVGIVLTGVFALLLLVAAAAVGRFGTLAAKGIPQTDNPHINKVLPPLAAGMVGALSAAIGSGAGPSIGFLLDAHREKRPVKAWEVLIGFLFVPLIALLSGAVFMSGVVGAVAGFFAQLRSPSSAVVVNTVAMPIIGFGLGVVCALDSGVDRT